MVRIVNQKIKFIKNLFTRGFCDPSIIKKIQVNDKRDYLVIHFSINPINNRFGQSKFYKVYKK